MRTNAVAIRNAARHAYVLSTYRGVLTVALLVAGFKAFPDQQIFVALAVLVFLHGVAALGATMNIFFLTNNHLDDMAERKTRHTILLARAQNEVDWEFWQEVDRRMNEEFSPDEPAPSFMVQTGLFAWGLLKKILADLLTIGVAVVFAG